MFGGDGGGHYTILLAMLAPALFMTATASLLQSANNRLARVVDRLRSLMRDNEDVPPEKSERRALFETQIARQRLRTRLILRACRLLYLALAAFVGTSLAVAADSLFAHRLVYLPTILAVAGVLLLLAACLYLSREAGLAVQALGHELDVYQKPPPRRKRS
jgi:flagellar biosynthesis protein FliQ